MKAHIGARMLAATLGLALSGCGGSKSPGSTPVITPVTVNRAPSITSPATASVVENGAGVALQAVATDPDGDAVTWSLSGTDAARFTINAAGEIRFVAAPNYERPADADANNSYRIELSASDGKASVSQSLVITVTNSREGIDVQRLAVGFDHPVAIVAIPGDNRLMVAERAGAIYVLDPATGQRTLYANVEGLTSALYQGILSIAVSPDFAANRVVYALVVHGSGRIAVRQMASRDGRTSYAEFPIAGPRPFSNDIGGWLGFGPDGLLYLAMGDPGGLSDASDAQSSTSLLGKLLTISRDSFDPYAGAVPDASIVPTLLARGLHKPGAGTFYAGGLLLPDHGLTAWEEVNALPLTPGTIENLGWPYREGVGMARPGEPAGLVPPVLQYPHQAAFSGEQVVGGFIYRGGNASLAGTYVILDITGAIFTVPLASLQRGTTLGRSDLERRDADFALADDTIVQPVSVVQDASGVIYMACLNGDILRITAS